MKESARKATSTQPPHFHSLTPTGKYRHRKSFCSIETTASQELPSLLELTDSKQADSTQLVISPIFSYNPSSYQDSLDFYPTFMSQKTQEFPAQVWFARKPVKREILVIWLDQVCLKFQFSHRSLSLSLSLLDRLSSTFNDENYETRILALLCLSLATKMLESPEKYLKLNLIFDFFDSKYSIESILEMEHCVFAAIDFNVCGKTTIDFLFYFMSKGIFSQGELESLPGIESTTQKLQFAELLLLNINFETLKRTDLSGFGCLTIACAIITHSRRFLRFPEWLDLDSTVSKHLFGDLQECVFLLSDLDLDLLAVSLDEQTPNSLNSDYLIQSRRFEERNNTLSGSTADDWELNSAGRKDSDHIQSPSFDFYYLSEDDRERKWRDECPQNVPLKREEHSNIKGTPPTKRVKRS